jgi:hypothetical protein
VPTTAPTVGPAIEVGLTYSMLGSQGSLRSLGAGDAGPVALRRMQRP